MALDVPDKERNVIPRWRKLQVTLQLNELGIPSTASVQQYLDRSYDSIRPPQFIRVRSQNYKERLQQYPLLTAAGPTRYLLSPLPPEVRFFQSPGSGVGMSTLPFGAATSFCAATSCTSHAPLKFSFRPHW